MTMMGYGGGFGFGLGGGGVLVALGCIAVVVGLAVLAVWAIGRSGQGSAAARTVHGGPATESVAARPDAVDVLRLRLARGEITVDEFTSAKQALEAGR
jgi:uncharacterized membrane protein